MNDIKRYDDMYYVIIDRKVTKTDKSNEFAIIGRFLDIERQCEKLRPENAEDRFFLNYQKAGRCTTQPIALENYEMLPFKIAIYVAWNSTAEMRTTRNVTSILLTLTRSRLLRNSFDSVESSAQNFLAQMDKRFAFYKCHNVIINFKK
ncbi:hypothetical protein Bhyg_09683 [Pseudolycoriella hygida]|uniref:Uncharacterized protein n=1 Tax=Pseudolycoriella hygida TaxID=35572 RepID=A0A9Q0MUW1_9DIPT|nr:hypothetical protein Bhyg_09683 [Pseudolycoriella hygida]